MQATPDKQRLRLVHQRRALRQLSRTRERLEQALLLAYARVNAAQQGTAAVTLAYEKFRGSYRRRLFGWHIHIWRPDWVLQWPLWNHQRDQRFRDMLAALHKNAYHAGGCGKFAADNTFDERRACTCGLATAFAAGGRCMCGSCRRDRSLRHERASQPLAVNP